MTQYARPNADVADAEWVNASMSATNLYASIDESGTANDSDYIKSQESGGSENWCKIGLGDTVTDPVK